MISFRFPSVDFSCFWCYWVCDEYGVPITLQLTEDWGEELFSALSRAGGKAFSNMAVGYNNVDVNAATKYGVAVGNTPVSYLFSRYYTSNACIFLIVKMEFMLGIRFSLIEYKWYPKDYQHMFSCVILWWFWLCCLCFMRKSDGLKEEILILT